MESETWSPLGTLDFGWSSEEIRPEIRTKWALGCEGIFQDCLFQASPGVWDGNEQGLLAKESSEWSRVGKDWVLADGIPKGRHSFSGGRPAYPSSS